MASRAPCSPRRWFRLMPAVVPDIMRSGGDPRARAGDETRCHRPAFDVRNEQSTAVSWPRDPLRLVHRGQSRPYPQAPAPQAKGPDAASPRPRGWSPRSSIRALAKHGQAGSAGWPLRSVGQQERAVRRAGPLPDGRYGLQHRTVQAGSEEVHLHRRSGPLGHWFRVARRRQNAPASMPQEDDRGSTKLQQRSPAEEDGRSRRVVVPKSFLPLVYITMARK